MKLDVVISALLLFLHISTVQGQSVGQCSSAKTCSACIKTHPSCKWCLDAVYDGSRCQSDLNQELAAVSCSNWYFPTSVYQPDIQPFSNIIQVQPGNINIRDLRPGETYNISVTVKSSQNYPLDVYYLMDFSFSMNGDLNELKELTEDITKKLATVSTDYNIGFGTFVDKPTSPYAKTDEGMLDKPCAECQAVHAFNHVMSMTGSATAQQELQDKLNALKISSNVDNPEGGFDAMVQAAVCSDVIGWRDVSRRVVFLATDDVFHVAGDGKLAGIVKPNQGQCGMTENKYTKSLTEDYPSLGQLNDVLIKNKVIPIFAVTANMQQLYEELSKHLTQLSSVGRLDSDSKAVADLIKAQLDSIVSSTQLNPQAPPGVSVQVVPRCSGQQTVMDNNQGCKGVSLEEEVKFDMIISVAECASEGENSYNFDIEIPGIATIPVSIEMICDCDCEKDGSEKKSAEECGGDGDLICSACQCHTGSYGEKCECNQKEDKDIDACINNSTGIICSGENNGKCICGQCECIQPTRDSYIRWGEFCECSNYECPRNIDNEICSNNGYCYCGACDCNKSPNGTPKQASDPQFTGDDCGCPVSRAACINPKTETPCTGEENGECVCGACRCKPNYFGEFCDICQDCGPLDCTIYEECVRCMYDNRNDDKSTQESCGCGSDYPVSLSDDDRVDTTKLGRHKMCEPLPEKENCDIIFYLHYEDRGAASQPRLKEVLIDRELDCPSQPNIIAIVAGVIGGILAIGIILLLLWKIYTTIVDKREYTKFLEERSKAKWNTGLSPLYKEPTTKYTNPLYTAATSRM